MHQQIPEGTCCSGNVLGEVDIVSLTVLYNAAIVHVVVLAAAAAGGNAAG